MTKKMDGNIFVEITNNCNFNCTFCPNSVLKRPRGNMDRELFYKVIDEIADNDLCHNVFFHLMGEPLLHPNVCEFMEYSSGKGIKIRLISNVGLINETNIEYVLRYVDHFEISLQSFDAESFASRKANRLTFDDYLASIKQIIEKKFADKSDTAICISMIENSKNSVKNFKGDAKFIDGNESLRRFFDTQWDEFFLEMEKKYGTQYKKLERFDFRHFGHEFLPGVTFNTRCVTTWANTMCRTKKVIPAIRAKCSGLHEQLGVLWNGDVVPCCLDYDGNVKLGNVRNQSLQNVMESDFFVKMKSGFKKGKLLHDYCKKCKGGTNLLSWFASQAYSFIKHRNI